MENNGKHFKAQKLFKFNKILGSSLNLNVQKSQKRSYKGALIKTAWEPVPRLPHNNDAWWIEGVMQENTKAFLYCDISSSPVHYITVGPSCQVDYRVF